jgi:aspartate carbamoyltransferase catalytic subunit
MAYNSDSPRLVLSVDDLTSSEIQGIFERSTQFKNKGFVDSRILNREPGNAPVVALAFFEPSTRTKLSFDAAAQRLGCKTIGFDNPESTSSAKGEQLEDTIRVIEQYADALVIRRKDEDTPDVVRAVATKPVVSAGVGAQEHPTQALLDVFTIKERRDLDSVAHVVSYGDLVNSRTMVSQVKLLARPGITMSFVADDAMQISAELEADLVARGATVNKTHSIDDVIADADMLHVIRPQRERWEGAEHSAYSAIDNAMMAKMKSDALVLHALPRTGELAEETDSDPRSVIWDQVRNGMFVRAALLEFLLD